MAKFTMNIESENAAFAEGGSEEVARLLRQAAEKVERGEQFAHCMDVNGNRVGVWDFEPTESEYWCDDCCEESTEEFDGTTCRECGRGIIGRVAA